METVSSAGWVFSVSLSCVFRAFETQARDGESQRLIGLFEDAPRGGVDIGKRLAHASGLRALAGE